MLFGRNMTPQGYAVRMVICLAADLFDLTVGRALFALPWEEGVSTVFFTLMWGPLGLLNLTELLDVTEQLDAFIPMATLVGLWAGYNAGMWGPKRKSPRLTNDPQAD